MCPISNVSGIVRLPRLGKIRLGIKVAATEDKSGYPKPVDYFVCPEPVQKVFGEQPKELQIMFPLEDPAEFAQQWLRCYSLTQGLVCIGDGELSRRKVDTETGEMASHTTKQWVWKEDLPCDPGDCRYYHKKYCRRVLNLQFLLPSVPGLGIWQIDTTSFYSIVNINSMIKMLKGLFGRCSMLPLTLALGPVEVSPQGMKKKTVYIMHVRQDNISLADLARVALLPPGRVLLPTPEAEEPPDDLFPQEILAEFEVVEEPGKPETKKEEEGKKAPPPLPFEEPGNDLILWQNIKELLTQGKGKVTDDLIQRWFRKHFSIEVVPEDFKQEAPADKFTKTILESFHNSLVAYGINVGKGKKGK